MATPSVTVDMSTFRPLPGGTPSPDGSGLQGAISYGVQQNPDKYAHLLDLQKRIGIPPAVSDGNEEQVRQDADTRSIDYPKFAATNPRTTTWASHPDNAAVAGVDEIHRLAGFEQRAAVMRSYTPTLWDQATTGFRQAVKAATGKTTDELQQGLYENPLTRGAIDVAGGVSGMFGNIGAFLGWHGDRSLSDVITGAAPPPNLLQRIETHLAPENNTDPAATFHKSNEFDWLMKNVAPMAPAVLASGGVGALARALKLSDTASKVLAGLTVGTAFDLDQAGKTYTAVAGAGGSDEEARLAANKVALINAPANALFGATDVVSLLRDNPLLTSLGLGGATGATGQIGQNVVTGQPWAKGVPSAIVQGAAVQGGLHLGLGSFAGHLADAVDSAEESKLRQRSPEKFGEALQTVFAGDASLKVPADRFQEYFRSKNMDPAQVAAAVGSTNYAEAVLSGGDVEVHPADYLSKLAPEDQKALLPHVVDPATGLTATQHAEGLEELRQWAAGPGPEQLQAEAAAADAETAATPEWQAVKEDLRQRYVDAGETPETAETNATLHANVVANLARESGRTPAELMAMYAPKVVSGEAPGVSQPLYQDAIEKIRGVVEAAKEEGHAPQKAVIAPVDPWLVQVAKENGHDIEGYNHVIDGSAVRHIAKEHGVTEAEISRGQLPVTAEDLEKIPEVVADSDRVIFGAKNKIGRDLIGHVKTMPDGSTLYVEEIRTGKKELAAQSMRKFAATMDADRMSANLHPNVQDDGIGTTIVARPGADKGEIDPEILHQEPLDRAGRQYDSPEMAEARSKAAAAEAAGDIEGAAQWTEKFNELREADPRFQKVLAARDAYVQAKAAASAARPGDPDLARTVNEAFSKWKDEAAKMRRYETAPAAGPRGWFRALPDGSFEIGKTKIGDLSTFVHEPAHAYLHMLRDLVSREGASEALKDDFAKIQEFLGAKDGEVLTREQQEKWARANEQYLREGKAPSEGLKGVFQRFAVWLGSIYKKATDLGVELTPEIREVFDRMYASEEGVNRAAQEAGPHLFTSAEEAGWTEEEFKRYADEHGVSIADAKAHILDKMNEAAARDQSQSWLAEVRNVRAAQAELIDARPEYKAIRGLRKGGLEDGTPLTLDKDSLVAQFGEDRVRKLREQHPGLYRANGSADAEAVAELHGFSSAEEMVRALEAAPRRNAAIEQATRAYMTAKYGDVRFDGTLDHKALLSLETGRANTLYRELKALKAKLGKLEAKNAAMRDIQVAPLEAYRDAAHQMIESKAVADLQPMRHLDATRKYSREAFDALRKGDARAAAEAKHKELMNHFLFREATEAKEYIGKFEANAKKWQGRTVQANLGLAGSDYRAQFNRLLFRYGLSGAPAEMPERPLSEWADEMYEQGKEPVMDGSMLNDARALNYRNASVAEVRNLHDALKNIKTLAYQEMHAVVNGRKIAFADAKSAMIMRARESLEVHPEAIFDEDRGRGEKARDLVNRGLAPLIRTEFLMKRLDGGVEGPWHDYLWNLAADSQGVERELQEGVTKIIGDALQNMPDSQRKRMMEKVVLPGWGELTRKRLISMALNLGNDGNLDRLRKTFQFHNADPAAVERIPKMLSREDWQLVQGLWDSLKPMGARMNEMERRLTGLPPVMVKPTPLHLDLADGSSIDLEGGYYPIVMDPRYSERAQQQDVNVTARNLMESGYGRAATSRGYTKERTGFAGPLLLDHEQVLTQHIAKASKDISHREFILAANRLLGDKELQQTLRETVGKGFEEQMMPWLRTIVNDRNGSAVQGLGDFSSWMSRLRTNVVEASLAFKLSTLLLQVTHASSIFLHTSPGSYAQAMVNFLAHPDEMTEQVRELSPNEMKHRGENIDRDMRAVLQDGIQGQRIGQVLAKAGMFPVKMVDHVLSFPLWLSVYQDALAEHASLPEERAQYLATHRADGAVRMALGANAPKDLPAVMRRNDFWKMVTTLGGFENLKLNQIADTAFSVGADRRAGVGRAASAGRFTYRMLMAAIIPAVVGAYVHGNRPKDDENSAEWAAKRALLFAPETVPLLGNVVRAIDEGGDAQFTPIINVVTKAVTAGVQAKSDKEDKDWTGISINAGEAAGMTAGVPGTTQAARTLRYVHRAQMGQISDPNAWDAVVGAPHK